MPDGGGSAFASSLLGDDTDRHWSLSNPFSGKTRFACTRAIGRIWGLTSTAHPGVDSREMGLIIDCHIGRIGWPVGRSKARSDSRHQAIDTHKVL
jgi:hypothetical protein